MAPYNSGFLNNRLQQKLESKLRQQVACVQPATPVQQDRRVIWTEHTLQHFDKSWIINAAKAPSTGAHHNAALPDKAPSRLPCNAWWQACWLLHLETSCCCSHVLLDMYFLGCCNPLTDKSPACSNTRHFQTTVPLQLDSITKLPEQLQESITPAVQNCKQPAAVNSHHACREPPLGSDSLKPPLAPLSRLFQQRTRVAA